MSAPPYSNNSTKTRRSRRSQKVNNHVATVSSEQNRFSVPNIATFKRSVPDELKTILRLEKVSLVLMSALVMTTLGLYAWAVYAPKIWTRDYRRLEKLQSDERNLITNNETLKNHLAKQAKNPASGLTDVRPFQSIFLPQTNKLSPRNPPPLVLKEKTKLSIQELETPVSY